MSVEDEVTAELDRQCVAGWERAAAIRLAVTIDDRGTASAVAQLRDLMSKLVGADPSAAGPGLDVVARMKAQLPAGMVDMGAHRVQKTSSGNGNPTAGKGRMSAKVR
ncbi:MULTISPECIES: hypothetical protein [unclassified Microbacterium]|uniref:hypothetical protein n=1 Tax=unclassified Microbacterium TaxID=2609290 RepID=UPI0036579A35